MNHNNRGRSNAVKYKSKSTVKRSTTSSNITLPTSDLETTNHNLFHKGKRIKVASTSGGVVPKCIILNGRVFRLKSTRRIKPTPLIGAIRIDGKTLIRKTKHGDQILNLKKKQHTRRHYRQSF